MKADMRGLCLQLIAVRTDLDTPKTKTGDLEQDRGINETTNRDRFKRWRRGVTVLGFFKKNWK